MSAQVLSPKRKAIADSSRTMFIWVMAMSAVVGVCVVVAIFLVQQIMFRAKVINKMTETASILSNNNKVANDLTNNVLVLETNPGLNAVKANPDEKALQTVLDALPADRNTLALGASLQQVLLNGVDGLTIDSLSVDSQDGGTLAAESSDNTIPIQIQVSANDVNVIKAMLVRLESSIRVIDVDSFALERSDTTTQATIQAHAYYQPAKQVQLKEVTVSPKDKN